MVHPHIVLGLTQIEQQHSGTPIQNSIDDVFALLHFLREDPWADISWWNRVISKPFENQDEKALVRLRAVLHPLLLRRTKDMLDHLGKPILELPPRVEETLFLEFSPLEHDFYQVRPHFFFPQPWSISLVVFDLPSIQPSMFGLLLMIDSAIGALL